MEGGIRGVYGRTIRSSCFVGGRIKSRVVFMRYTYSAQLRSRPRILQSTACGLFDFTVHQVDCHLSSCGLSPTPPPPPFTAPPHCGGSGVTLRTFHTSRLVRYYRIAGFQAEREVGEDLGSLRDRLTWGAEGTLMTASAEDFMRRWTTLMLNTNNVGEGSASDAAAVQKQEA